MNVYTIRWRIGISTFADLKKATTKTTAANNNATTPTTKVKFSYIFHTHSGARSGVSYTLIVFDADTLTESKYIDRRYSLNRMVYIYMYVKLAQSLSNNNTLIWFYFIHRNVVSYLFSICVSIVFTSSLVSNATIFGIYRKLCKR